MAKDALYYEVIANKTTGETDLSKMQVVDQKVVPQKQVLDEQHELCPKLTREQHEMSMLAFAEIIARHAAKGHAVRTCVIETSHSIEGPVDTEGVFNPAKNRIRLNARAAQAASSANSFDKSHLSASPTSERKGIVLFCIAAV
jgi:hypothetical protein